MQLDLLQLYHLHCITTSQITIVTRCILRPERAPKYVCGRGYSSLQRKGRFVEEENEKERGEKIEWKEMESEGRKRAGMGKEGSE